MKSILVVLCILGLQLGAICAQQPTMKRVNVSVYYESLCPDSKKFITTQLYPALQTDLAKYVTLTLAPYGKTTTTYSNGEPEFQCHHGPNECWGNIYHACALRNINRGNNTSGLGYNKVAVAFVNCLMDIATLNRTATPQEIFAKRDDCAAKGQVENVRDIENCVGHPDGMKYLAEVGKLTNALQQPLGSVPTIVFQNQLKSDDVALAQKNFVKALCQYIAAPQPAECTRNGASAPLGATLGAVLTMGLVKMLI